MKRLLIVLTSVLLLSACGGGGGGGGGGDVWPSEPVQSGIPTPGTLSAQDVLAPDGSYVDLYTFSLAQQGDVDIQMSSTMFDTYLVLLDGAAMQEPDKQKWNTYTIDLNDDIDVTTSDSRLTITLAAGSYAIAATSFNQATSGDYLLTMTSNSFSVTNSSYLQYRTFEDPANNHFRAWIDLLNNGSVIQASDIQSVTLFDANNQPFDSSVPPQFIAGPFTIAGWNPATTKFESVRAWEQSGYFLNLSNHLSMPAGGYTFEVTPTSGAMFTHHMNYLGQLALIPVASASMAAQWNPDGSLTLSWSEPVDVFDQYRVVFNEVSGNDLLYARVPRGTTQVTLDAATLLAIRQDNQLTLPTTLSWQMQTRSYDGANNYARSVSDPVTITWQ